MVTARYQTPFRSWHLFGAYACISASIRRSGVKYTTDVLYCRPVPVKLILFFQPDEGSLTILALSKHAATRPGSPRRLIRAVVLGLRLESQSRACARTRRG